MAKQRIIKRASDRMPIEKRIAVMNINVQQYCDSWVIDEETKNKRLMACCNCDKLTASTSCSELGKCPTSRKDFYKMHLNRKNGGCPIGQW